MHHPTDRITHVYHGLCYTSRRALAGTRNSLMGPPWRMDPTTHRTMSERSYHGVTSCSQSTILMTPVINWVVCLAQKVLVVTLLEVSEREREEGVVALHLPIGLLKTRSGLETVSRCEPNTYQPIRRWHSHCAIGAGPTNYQLTPRYTDQLITSECPWQACIITACSECALDT